MYTFSFACVGMRSPRGLTYPRRGMSKELPSTQGAIPPTPRRHEDDVALGGFLGRERWRSRCNVREVEVADGLDDDAGLVGDVLTKGQFTARN